MQSHQPETGSTSASSDVNTYALAALCSRRLTVPAPEKEQQCAPAVPVESCASYTADSPTGADFPSTLGGHSGAPSTTGYNPLLAKDQNSVTIKANTSVKDSAGAIMKVRQQGEGAGRFAVSPQCQAFEPCPTFCVSMQVLERLSSTVVTALKQEPGHEALNRAVKALAVCRKVCTAMPNRPMAHSQSR